MAARLLVSQMGGPSRITHTPALSESSRYVHLKAQHRPRPVWFPGFRREKDFQRMDPSLVKKSDYPGYSTILDEPGVYPFPRDPPQDEAGATGPGLMSPGDARTLQINKASTGNALDAE